MDEEREAPFEELEAYGTEDEAADDLGDGGASNFAFCQVGGS